MRRLIAALLILSGLALGFSGTADAGQITAVQLVYNGPTQLCTGNTDCATFYGYVDNSGLTQRVTFCSGTGCVKGMVYTIPVDVDASAVVWQKVTPGRTPIIYTFAREADPIGVASATYQPFTL